MAKIARVDDHLDIRVCLGEASEDSDRIIRGRVIDEDMLVAELRKASERVSSTEIELLYVVLLVVAGANDANEFQWTAPSRCKELPFRQPCHSAVRRMASRRKIV